MSRKRCHRRAIVPMAPRGLRPRLDRGQLRDLAMCHLVNLDTIARGDADVDTLWQWAGGVFTWHRVAQLLGEGEPQMDEQLALAQSVLERYRRTGRVRFSGPDYQLAKLGVDLMDTLAERVDRATAVAAAAWSEAKLNSLVAATSQEQQAAFEAETQQDATDAFVEAHGETA